MFGSILQRSIFWELIKAFAMSLVALTGILLLAGIVAEASQRGLTPGQILEAIPLIIPSLMPYTIPSTTLFATCLVYGRLSHDNEIIAIKSAGINVLKVIWPAVTMGILTSAATMALYYHVIPNTQYVLRAQFIKDVEEFLYSMLKTDRSINHPRLNYAIWVRQVEGRRLLDATFKRRDLNGNYDLAARAREAELRVDSHNQMVLVHMKHGEVYSVSSGTRAYFEDKIWEVKLPTEGLGPAHQRKPREMTWRQLLAHRAALTEEMAGAAQELEHPEPRADLARHVENLKVKQFHLNREQLAVQLEVYMRPAIAVGCLCFVLVGCPIGIWFSKSDYLSAFITCFLPIVFLYYPLLLCGINLARNGRFNPVLTLGACNFVLLGVSLVLMRRLIRH